MTPADPYSTADPDGPPPRLRDLGLSPVINAAATLTKLGGSRLAPPVLAAMAEAAGNFVDLPELHRRVGERLATVTRNEAAYVTSGAAAGMSLAIAGCVTGLDPATRESFPARRGTPLPVGWRNRVAICAAQRNPYDYSVRQLGVTVDEFDADPSSLGKALRPDTACVLWFAGEHYAVGAPELPEVIATAKAAGVPVIVDAAAQIPPVSALWHFTGELGADAVIFSGGKGLRGPQSSGLVLGTHRIIEGTRLHSSPNHAFGRGMKVGKEELLGLLAAVEWTVARDETALLTAYEESVRRWVDGLTGFPGIRVERGYPSEAGQPHGRALLWLDEDSGWTRDSLTDALWRHDPPVAVGAAGDAVALNPQPLDPGEDLVVLDAVRSVLSAGPAETAP
ncbi:PLP-dependent transferase [Actinoalloteichus hymeniacidonis]|uniref:Selenocysteine synthase (Seryl-tRNASer selenium transferase) n=1 Tax=Actinoalloteichus hymeniacidonis TaxID=340345 RepID=A0AAC9MZ74_9PSEU|nr:PLP-dependent transferase [Actinoalloteichus hymeniacidonis]AOS64184.1 selenocysteine synthase (seryl-tRNASer selenium transferase) [Actinoalloteichus hymeniacidonis]MBB5907748.1 L-seryl-tRNA(Ser) seleniumtransferase [Actinoalloteichus hymeniacidonis]